MLLRGRSNEIPRSNEGDGQQSSQTRSRRRSPSITSTEDAPPPTNAAQQIARGVMPTFGAGASYSQDMSPTTDAARENVPSGSQSHGNDTTLHPEEQSSRGPTNEVDSSITESPNPSWYETWWEKLQSYMGFSYSTDSPDLQESEDPQSPREEREHPTLLQERMDRWRNVTRVGHEEHYKNVVTDPTEQLNNSLRRLCLSEYKNMTQDDKKLVSAANDVYSDMIDEYEIKPDDQRTLMLGVLLQGGPGGSASRNLIGREIRDPSYIKLKKDFLTRLQKKMIENDTKPAGTSVDSDGVS